MAVSGLYYKSYVHRLCLKTQSVHLLKCQEMNYY